MTNPPFSPLNFLAYHHQDQSLDTLVPTEVWGRLYAEKFLRWNPRDPKEYIKRVTFLFELGGTTEDIRIYGLLVETDSPIEDTSTAKVWDHQKNTYQPSLSERLTQLIGERILHGEISTPSTSTP